MFLCVLVFWISVIFSESMTPTVLTKTTAARNKVVLGYHRVHGLYFQAVVFAAIIHL